MILRLLSFNIHKGQDWRGKDRLNDLKQAILASNADIVFLQEIHGKHLEDQAELETLADEIWQDFSYAKNSANAGGDYGNAILSRYPIVSSEYTDLSTNRFEKRNIQRVVIDCEGIILSCFNTHLNLLRKSRKNQLAKISNIIKECPNPYQIVAGDFNDWRSDTKILEVEFGFKDSHHEVYGEYARSFPAPMPFLRLDRLMVKGVKVNSCQLLNDHIWKKLSDHLPIFCEIILPST